MRNSGESFNSGEQDRSNNPNRNRGNMSYRATLEQTQENLSRRERLSRMSDEELRKLQRELMAKKEQEEKARMERGTPTEAPVPQETPVETPVPQEAPTESSETEEASPETISEEEAEKTKERAEKKPAVRSLFNKATAMLIAGSIFVGAFAGAAGAGVFDAKREALKDNQPKVEENYDKTEKQEQKEKEKQFDNLTGIEVLDEDIDGSFEQDDNVGCYEDGNKVSPNSLGNPNAILKEMGVDPKDATPEQRGKITEYLSYSMKYPAAYNAIAYGISGFEDLTINEAEDKISNMSANEKEDLQKQLKKLYDNSTYSTVTGQGVYKNQGVAEREDGRHSFYVESNLTGEEILRRETKMDDGSTVELFFRVPCAGNGLDQIVVKAKDGGTPTTITIREEKPEPPEKLQPKNTAAEKKHAGPRVNQQKLDEKKTPKTSVKQDYKAVDKAHEQVKSGDMAGSKKEKERQQKVDNSRETKKNDKEAKSNADNSAEERAKQFEEGDF